MLQFSKHNAANQWIHVSSSIYNVVKPVDSYISCFSSVFNYESFESWLFTITSIFSVPS